ncbi:hypothetical protein B0H15DRAFT_745564, partial [Mycena belliarum]
WVLQVRGLLASPRVSPTQACLVQWSKKNPEPWNSIRQDEGVKMMQIHQKFDKRF